MQEEKKPTPVPFTSHGEIKYHIDWIVRQNEENPDKKDLAFEMRYVQNPEVMMVIAEILRHQLSEVLEKDKTKKKKDRMTPYQIEVHKKTIVLCNSLVSHMGEIVYEKQLQERERLSKIATGEIPDLEIVSDPKVEKIIKEKR